MFVVSEVWNQIHFLNRFLTCFEYVLELMQNKVVQQLSMSKMMAGVMQNNFRLIFCFW